MTDIAIRVENLSKRYNLGRARPQHDTLRDALTSPFVRRGARPPEDILWALKDVSFEVRQGEVVGVIGRNGAGKSTLLKILSRITEPTSGRAEIHGRVGSLLEVGTGFHPELTGRENIYLNGAILGMRRVEIDRRFDEIVAFAEIERFLDTPVKRYSSGMYVRLAFAVAAHLEPEILLVDEVLAVGDVEFQKKCLGKMDEVGKGGRTVLFVSHNMSAVQRLCPTVLYLEDGRTREFGDVEPVVALYHLNSNQAEQQSRSMEQVRDAKQTRFVGWSAASATDASPYTCMSRDSCEFAFRLIVGRPLRRGYLGFTLRSLTGDLIVSTTNQEVTGKYVDFETGEFEVRFRVRLPLKPGRYQPEIALLDGATMEQIDFWASDRFLTVLPQSRTELPEHWQGLLNEEAGFACKRLNAFDE